MVNCKIIYLIVFVVNVNISFAQTKLHIGEVKTGNYTYLINDAHFVKEIHNKKNIIALNHDKLYSSDNISVESKEEKSIQNAFKAVFSDTRLKQLLPERSIIVTYYIDQLGNAAELSYILSADTLISAEEIALLDYTLNNKVKFNVGSINIPLNKYIQVTQRISITKLLNNSLN